MARVTWTNKSRLNSNSLKETKSQKMESDSIQSLIDSGLGIKVMRAFMPILIEKWQRKIRKMNIGYTGDLSAEMSARAYKNASSLKGQSKFNFYGRMVDMGVGKGRKLYEAKTGIGLTRTRANNLAQRRAKKWYGPTLAHQHARLAEVMAEAQAGELAAITASRLRTKISIEL